MVCNGPLAENCQPVVKPQFFYTETACEEDASIGIEYFTRQGLYVRGECIEIVADLA